MRTLEEVLMLYRLHPQFMGAELGSVNAKGAMGDTPLHIACGRNSLQEVADLLALGAEVNVRGDRGFTPVQMAIQQGSAEMTGLLLKHGADLDVKDDHDCTARQEAAFSTVPEIKSLAISPRHG